GRRGGSSTIEVVPRELGLEDGSKARGSGQRSRHEFVHADQRAHDDHTEALDEAERDSDTRPLSASFGDHVTGYLENGGRHASQPPTRLSQRGLCARGRREHEHHEQHDERSKLARHQEILLWKRDNQVSVRRSITELRPSRPVLRRIDGDREPLKTLSPCPPRAIGVRDLAGEPERTAVVEQRVDSEVLDQELASQHPHGPRMPEDVLSSVSPWKERVAMLGARSSDAGGGATDDPSGGGTEHRARGARLTPLRCPATMRPGEDGLQIG